MTTASKERSYWKTNKDWYRVNDKGEYELTENAPPEAVDSFKAWSTPRREVKCPFKDLSQPE